MYIGSEQRFFTQLALPREATSTFSPRLVQNVWRVFYKVHSIQYAALVPQADDRPAHLFGVQPQARVWVDGNGVRDLLQ